jgi:glycosyltransferase involved in cell wall biosynthesis
MNPSSSGNVVSLKTSVAIKTGLLADLPAPSSAKTGWPWTEETAVLPGTLPNGKPWPRITVVTPSFNQGKFIEQTIRSVLLQNYPALEYLIIDGGSSDESVEIIKKYATHFAYWVSEHDGGQAHAINKGFARATGDILCWLNSDDYFTPGALTTVAECLTHNHAFALVGHCLKINSNGRSELLRGHYESRRRLFEFWKGYTMHQSSIFWRREVLNAVGFLDEKQHYILDYEYWVRISAHFSFRNVDQILSCNNYHLDAKTGDNYRRYYEELRRNAPYLWGSRLNPQYWSLALSMYKSQCHGISRGFAQRFQPLTTRALNLKRRCTDILTAARR